MNREWLWRWLPDVARRARARVRHRPAPSAVAGWLALTCLCATPALSGDARLTVSLDHGWRFKQSGQIAGAESRAFDDSGWAAVDVPHTWTFATSGPRDR
jgi:hypothetical protein